MNEDTGCDEVSVKLRDGTLRVGDKSSKWRDQNREKEEVDD